jgi:hypothetical protein
MNVWPVERSFAGGGWPFRIVSANGHERWTLTAAIYWLRTMPGSCYSRRDFVKAAGTLAGGSLLFETFGCKQPAKPQPKEAASEAGPADYTLTIAVKPVELAPNRIVSTVTYNGQVPGPLLRFKEGQPVTIHIHNETDIYTTGRDP